MKCDSLDTKNTSVMLDLIQLPEMFTFCFHIFCRKAESCDMQDLVQMMTQTLRMDIEDSVNEADKGIFGLTALPEFKINRKYRDTLALHGKSREEGEDLSLGHIPLGLILLSQDY